MGHCIALHWAKVAKIKQGRGCKSLPHGDQYKRMLDSWTPYPPFLPIKGQIKKKVDWYDLWGGMGLGFSFFWWPHLLASLFLLMQTWALYCYVHLRRCPLFSWGCNSGLWKPDTNASTEAALPWETHQVISKFWIIVHSSQSSQCFELIENGFLSMKSKKRNCNMISRKWGGIKGRLELFPNIHLFWRRQPSLKQVVR